MVDALKLWEEMPEPGRSFYEGEGLEDRLPSRIAQKEGWSGQGSPKGMVRDAFPWLDPRTMGADYNLSDLRDALRRGKGQVYDRFLEAAAEYVKAQREAGNPLMREPGEDEAPF